MAFKIMHLEGHLKNAVYRHCCKIKNITYAFDKKTGSRIPIGHFPSQPWLASCLLDSQSPVILIHSNLTGQAKTLHAHTVLWAVPHPLTVTTIPRSFEAEVFTGRMSSSHTTNSKSTEGIRA